MIPALSGSWASSGYFITVESVNIRVTDFSSYFQMYALSNSYKKEVEVNDPIIICAPYQSTHSSKMFQKPSMSLCLAPTFFSRRRCFFSEKKCCKDLTENRIWIWGVVGFFLAVPLRGILILYCLLLRKAEFYFCGWEYSFHMEAFAIC